ncbi:hypothetical protein K449DRAFT_437406 [Hypoxylon sp. EC38]|nr:hypothetical protein K449DRAFT_437406 [Hypoxylon sp. EC38]
MAAMTPEFDMSSQRPSQLPPCPGPPPSRPLPPLPKMPIANDIDRYREHRMPSKEAARDRIMATKIIGQRTTIGEEFLGFRSLLLFCPFPALDSSKVPPAPDPLASLQPHSFAHTCTNPASTLMNGILQNQSMPLRSRQRTTSNTHLDHPIFAFRMQQLLRIFQSWLRITNSSYILSSLPGPVYLYYLQGISIFNIDHSIHWAWEESYQLFMVGKWGLFTGPPLVFMAFPLFFNVVNCTIEKALPWHRSSKKNDHGMRWIPPREDGGRIHEHGNGFGDGLRNSHE